MQTLRHYIGREWTLFYLIVCVSTPRTLLRTCRAYMTSNAFCHFLIYTAGFLPVGLLMERHLSSCATHFDFLPCVLSSCILPRPPGVVYSHLLFPGTCIFSIFFVVFSTPFIPYHVAIPSQSFLSEEGCL